MDCLPKCKSLEAPLAIVPKQLIILCKTAFCSIVTYSQLKRGSLCDLKETESTVFKKPSTDLMFEEKTSNNNLRRQGDVTVVKIEALIKSLDHNVEKLEAKSSRL